MNEHENENQDFLQEESFAPNDSYEDISEPPVKERNGFVSFWLVIGIIGCLIGAAMDLAEGLSLMTIISIICEIVGFVGYVLLLKWKKVGYWMVVGSVVATNAVSLVFFEDDAETLEALSYLGVDYSFMIGFTVVTTIIALVGLWGILQISKDGHRCWKLMD